MIRAKFPLNREECGDDYRPVKQPVKYPYWSTGKSAKFFELVAYADNVEQIRELWPEAHFVEYRDVDEIEFTHRFPKSKQYNDMEEQFVSYETAKMLKKVGFDVPCYEYYMCFTNGKVSSGVYENKLNHNLIEWDADTSRPTQALAARWLREVHELHVSSDIYTDYSTDADGNTVKEWTFWDYSIYSACGGNKIMKGNERYDTYEEAMEVGLQEAIKLI